ncbi:MAG: hypothetical protein JRJ00_00005, partial [Deltaproteobacteria bacterium]|nr:hypothetical protein [Deltaproteobacteria bacterium]
QDTIEIKSGIISQREYNGKWYNDIVIFEAEVMSQGQRNDKPVDVSFDNNSSSTFEDDIPW